LIWADVGRLVGDELMASCGLVDHRPDCGQVKAQMSNADVRELGRSLAGQQARSPGRVLAAYLAPVPRAHIAQAFGCPLYVIGPTTQIPHVEYHRLLDLHADPAAWATYVAEKRAAYRTERGMRTALQSVFAESVVGNRKARADLGLAAWQMDLAFASGLLNRVSPSSGVLAEELAAALADRPGFLRKLQRQEPINAGQAALALGIPRAHFAELVQAGLLKSCGTGTFKWGTYALYRRGEVEDLLPQVPALSAARKQAISQRRKQAAKAAPASRARNEAATARARLSTQTELVDILATTTDPFARALAVMSYWTALVGHHADLAHDKAQRARSPASTSAHRATADACYAAKNEALAVLARVHDPRVIWNFYDGSRLWLCDECMQAAHDAGIHPAEYKELLWCNHCTVDNYYSVLSAEVFAASKTWELTVPLPLALEFAVEQPTVQLAAIEPGGAHRRAKPPPWRKLNQPPFESLPAWIRAVKDSRCFELSDLITPPPAQARLAGHSPANAVESLRAATASLVELLGAPL
jgi:hypothetical protein